MNISFFCPICQAPISHEERICGDCARKLDSECFDSMLSRCPSCHFPKLNDDYLCERCNNGQRKVHRIYPVARYDGSLSHSILYSFKFKGHKELARVIALYLERALSVLDPEGKAVLVPVPCSEQRLVRYGWDHMLEVVKALKRPYLCLIANRDSLQQQKSLDREQRLSASSGKFIIDPECKQELEDLKGNKVIVVDDIATTLSTMNSAIDLLEAEGFTEVLGASWLCEL